jgi:uncharacterized protein (DUF849 family)
MRSAQPLVPPAFDLHEANSKLRFWLDNLALDQPNTAPVTPEQMAGLLSELMRAGQWLRTRPTHVRDQESEVRVNEYRENLERIRDLLPAIHHQLLAERSRLESERTRVESAAVWAQRSRQTL